MCGVLYTNYSKFVVVSVMHTDWNVIEQACLVTVS